MLAGMRQRGGKADELYIETTMTLEGTELSATREQQTLAALSAWGPDQPLERLGFIGDPQLTRAVTSAVLAAQPKQLVFDCSQAEMIAGRRCNATLYASISLLDQLGPGLTCVQLHNVGHWPPVILEPLSYCTALTRLALDLAEGCAWCDVDLQEAIRVAGGLKRLTDLDLQGGPEYDGLREATLRLDRLAALTGLTRLCLSLSAARQRPYTYADLAPGEAQLWRQERSQLLTAVSSMSALEELLVTGMWLEVRAVAALRRLRVLSLGGLMLPPLPGIRLVDEEDGEGGGGGGAGQDGEDGGEGVGEPAAQGPAGPALRERWPLPPELEELHLESPSPSLLAALVPGPKLSALFLPAVGSATEGWTSLQLNRLEMKRLAPANANGPPNYVSRPEAASAFAPAAELLQRCIGGGTVEGLRITAAIRDYHHVRRGLHASWLPALAPLAPVRLRLERIALNDEDVTALVRHFPQITALELEQSPIPLASLPRLSALPSLRELTICIQGLPRDEPIEQSAQLVVALATAASSLQVLRASSMRHPDISAAMLLITGQALLEAVRPGFRIELDAERGPWEDR
ncbi:hypothetical protein HYH03_016907 [Edaphochlamys debaryana]|nr:hypothetical protein HYH03_016907 [Edaphochlamys debaryana]|eukprot:KAG2484262.1 hypothetical protein HYH03_016907 [Edaphochlamys debaryana]